MADRNVRWSKHPFSADRRSHVHEESAAPRSGGPGHAHAGVWLIVALVAFRYVAEANLPAAMKWFVRGSMPSGILVPAAFFLSVLSPGAKAPNGLIHLAYLGAALLALACIGPLLD